MTEVITIENNLRLSNSSSGPGLQTIQLKDDPQIRSAGGGGIVVGYVEVVVWWGGGLTDMLINLR